jgi:hypothetical protein
MEQIMPLTVLVALNVVEIPPFFVVPLPNVKNLPTPKKQ